MDTMRITLDLKRQSTATTSYGLLTPTNPMINLSESSSRAMKSTPATVIH